MPLLSIVIVTYNSEKAIGACLNSIVACEYSADRYEIIVVDNRSADGTTAVVENHVPTVLLHRLPANSGFARAANVGASMARGDALLFLNPDVVVGRDFLPGIGTRIASDPEMRLAGCRLTDEQGTPLASAWLLPSSLTITVETLLPHRAATALLRSEQPGFRRGRFVSGACLLVHRTLFASLGGFDERFFLYYEDTDLCARAERAGVVPCFVPEISIVHLGRRSFRGDMGFFFVQFYRSKMLYCRLHFPPASAVGILRIIRLGIRLRCIAFRFLGAVPGLDSFGGLSRHYAAVLNALQD
jgi:N-acetylglucosaminyl-diphospho-decaprenol L-rhamnosyltransferase